MEQNKNKNKNTIKDESVKTEETIQVEIKELDDLDLAKVAGGNSGQEVEDNTNCGCI